jgi:hypothetical protein
MEGRQLVKIFPALTPPEVNAVVQKSKVTRRQGTASCHLKRRYRIGPFIVQAEGDVAILDLDLLSSAILLFVRDGAQMISIRGQSRD